MGRKIQSIGKGEEDDGIQIVRQFNENKKRMRKKYFLTWLGSIVFITLSVELYLRFKEFFLVFGITVTAVTISLVAHIMGGSGRRDLFRGLDAFENPKETGYSWESKDGD